MTWKEFVEYVEQQMKEKGVPENAEIEYIDLNFLHGKPEVTEADKNGFAIYD